MTSPSTRPWLGSLSNLDLALIALAFALAATGFLLGEKIQVGDGLGWDGSLYGEWAKDFYSSVIVGRVDDYYIHRTLPSAVVHYSLRLISADLTNENVIRGFGLLNVICITASAIFWSLIANELNIHSRGKILGFVSLFINYSLLKFPSYYPVLTDVPSFAIGMAMLYSYLTTKRVSLIALIVAGSLVWPTLAYEGAILLLFPRGPDDVPVLAAPRKLNGVVAFSVAFTAAAYMIWLISFNSPGFGFGESTILLRPLGIVLCFLYLFFGLRVLLDYERLFNIAALLRRAMSPAFYVSLLFVVALNRLAYSLSSKNSEVVTLGSFITDMAFAGSSMPLVLVAHVVFFGPVIIIALFCFKPVCRLLQEYGIGLVLAVTVGFILSLNSESRRIGNFLPLIIPFLVKVVESLNWRLWHYWVFGSISIIFSKIWLKIGGAPDSQDMMSYTSQLYYMNFGPFMSVEMYAIQGIAVVIVAGLLCRFCWSPPRNLTFRSSAG